MQKNNLEEILLSRITSAGMQISKRDCQIYGAGLELKYYEDQIELAVKIYDKIVDCADIYFGIRANQMSEALTRSVVKQIMVDYPDLTVEEIEHCFERFVQPKTDWRNITKLELLEPIKKYYLVKLKIKSEIKKLEVEEIEKEGAQKKANDFYDLSIEKYNESLKAGKWLGDLFMALTIHRKFRNRFTDEQVEKLKQNANVQYNQYQEKNSFLYFAYSRERILAQLVVEIAIENKWQIKG